MNRKKSTILLVVGLVILLLGAGVVSGINTNQGLNTPLRPIAAGRDWSENFDSYEAGSQLHGQGGWYAWDNNSAATGYVSDAQARSLPNSLEGKWFTTVASDMVHQFFGYDTGTWVFSVWLYVPSSMTGRQFCILMNKYIEGSHVNQDWSLQVEFSAEGGYIRDYDNNPATLPLVTDQWMELKAVIDLEADVDTVYYGGTQFIQKSWKDGVSPGGQKNIACVDLFAGDVSGTTSCYWDDVSLLPPIPPLTCDADGPYTGMTGQAIQFTGSADGGIPPYTWAWSFGDGGTAAVQNPTHVYATPGVYDVTLTVTDSMQTVASDETTANITKAPEPLIQIGNITGGKGVSVKIKNIGEANATMVPWSINITKGILLKGRLQSGTILQLGIGEERTIASKVFGFGRVTITVTAGDKQKQATAFVFLIFVLGVK
jgi:hypothetical protein